MYFLRNQMYDFMFNEINILFKNMVGKYAVDGTVSMEK